MTEEKKSPWQLEHERMLRQQEAAELARERAKRAKFLRGLKLKRKSDRNLHSIKEAARRAQAEKDAVSTQNRPLEEDELESIELTRQAKESKVKKYFESIGPAFKKIWPPLGFFTLIFLVSLYALSSFSRISSFQVEGNNMVTSNHIASASKIMENESIYRILLNRDEITSSISKSSPRIKSAALSIKFPNHVFVDVTEFKSIGYVEQNKVVYAILANGTKVAETQVASNKIPKNALLLKNFSDQQIKQFTLAYDSLNPDLQKRITTVSLTPSQSTADFMTLQMTDGNQVKVPLSQMKQKLPYYPAVAKEIKAPMTVDMEVGIFASPTADYNKNFADDKPVVKKDAKASANQTKDSKTSESSSASSSSAAN